jgi:hypothetical protein
MDKAIISFSAIYKLQNRKNQPTISAQGRRSERNRRGFILEKKCEKKSEREERGKF